MHRSTRLLLCTLGLWGGCGRGQLDPAGLSAGTVERDAAVNPRADGGGPGPDRAIGPDARPGPDGFITDLDRVDGSAPFECRAPADCFATLGTPRCPDGPGRWQCIDGLCNPECPVPACRTDCDCPFDLSCSPMGCLPLNRPNFCCANPSCAPGQACVNPDGSASMCPGGGIDGGVRDGGRDGGGRDGGRPPRDGGVRDGGGPPDLGTATCGSDCDCDPFLACLNGQCLPAGRPNLCCASPGCPPGAMCINPDGTGGICGVTPTPVGAPCDASGAQCGTNGFCIDETSGFPGGYCTAGCDAFSPCPTGASCRDSGGGGSFCLDECVNAGDCRPGYNCIQLGVSGGSRVCWPAPPTSTNPMGLPVGSACGSDQECVSGTLCLQEQGFPDGYCTTLYCDPMTNPCPGSSACYAFPGLFSLCLAGCPSGGTQSTCRPQYYCLGPSGQPGVCIGN